VEKSEIMELKNKIAVARQIKDIWIPPSGRPYWTTHNKRGNAGVCLTDEELQEYGLKENV